MHFLPISAQTSPDAPGPYLTNDMIVSFTDASLSSPSVSAKVYFPVDVGGAATPAVGHWPVISFGHGFNIGYLNYENILQHLASWGFIIVNPDVQNGFAVDHLEFAKQLKACILWAQAGNSDTTSILFDRVDMNSGSMGHSMGGGATYLLPSVFPGVTAICGLTPAETTPSAVDALDSVSVPVQVISGSADNVASESTNQQPMYDNISSPKQWVSLTGAGHCRFTDGPTICDLVSAPGSLSNSETQNLTKRYATAFFSYYLAGDSSMLPFLCGDSVLADSMAGLIVPQTNISACSLILERKIDRPQSGLSISTLPESIQIDFEHEGQTEKAMIECFTMSGKRVFQREIQLTLGKNMVQIETHSLPKGILFLKMSKKDRVWFGKIIVI